MKQYYYFNYNCHEAEIFFTVDNEIFTEEIAKKYLGFLSRDYNKEADPKEELLRKYAFALIDLSACAEPDKEAIKKIFASSDGNLMPLDGSKGVELTAITPYKFDEDLLRLEITPYTK